jgi:predicted lactoylglutathione lyase
VGLGSPTITLGAPFFRALGFDFDEKFTDESCACMFEASL